MLRNEEGRQAAVEACAILDTPREPSFDSVVFTVAQLFRAPIAILFVVDKDRFWAKASVGPLAHEWKRKETFCQTVIETGKPLFVEDTALDPRFASLKCVTEAPQIRFCASAPLLGPKGYVIGTLCVVGYQPRMIGERQRAQFEQIARQAGELLRLRVPGLDLTE